MVVYGLFDFIFGRWRDLCFGSAFDGKDKADARQDYGDACGIRSVP